MSTFTLAVLGFASGWVIAAVLLTRAKLSEERYKGLLGVLAMLAGLSVLGIMIGEANHQAWAFETEDAIVEARWATISLWMLAGVAVYPFRGPIKQFLADLTALTLKAPASDGGSSQEQGPPPPTGPHADQASNGGAAPQTGNVSSGGASPTVGPAAPVARGTAANESRYLPLSLPWSIEAGIFTTIIIIALVALNPKMLQGLTSFKAGVIEAHFAASGPILQKGQVAVADVNRKSVFDNWTEFDINDPRRTELYGKNGTLNNFSKNFAAAIFQGQITPVFEILDFREHSYLKLSSENLGRLQNFSIQLANLIESNLDQSKKDKTAHSPDEQIKILKKISQEILVFRCSVDPPSQPSECSEGPLLAEATCVVANLHNQSAAQCGKIIYPDTITRVEHHYKETPDATTAEDIWDPYVIQAVADLLGRAMSSRERANFLEVTTSILEKGDYACVADVRLAPGARLPDARGKTCAFPDPGLMSLVYAAVEAKVESEQPWPFEHMFQQVSNLLADTRKLIDADDLMSSTRALERRNRLIDLSLGLQLFYQRALTGQRFTPAQLQSWSEWLREARAAMSVIEEAGGGDAQYLDAGEKKAWSDARATIEQDPAVVQDAATAAALSSVLLPALGGGATGADCLKARALIDFAADRNLEHFYAGLRFDPDEKATYQGLVEQMRARIENECE